MAWTLVIVIFVLIFAGFFFGLMWLADAFRAYPLHFAFLWLIIPIFAILLNHHLILESFTLVGLRRIRGVLMIVVVVTSVMVFFDRGAIRNPIGKSLVQGYRHWRGEPEMMITDEGKVWFYSEDIWTASDQPGRWALQLFDVTLMVGVVLVPTITWKASDNAIWKKKKKCQFSADGTWIEKYESGVQH